MNKDSLGDRVGEVCGDNRFEIIQRAKEDLINSTNIEIFLKEIKILDNFFISLLAIGMAKTI